jgi:hypothetical protein
MGDIRLFVSHAHKDKKLAAALVEVIEAAMVKQHRILCTKHEKEEYSYPENEDVREHLRAHLSQSAVVLALLTPNSLASPWCLIELGGAWVLAKRTYLLFAGGISQESLPPALNRPDAIAIQLEKPEDIQKLLAKLYLDLGWPPRYQGSAIDRLVALCLYTK